MRTAFILTSLLFATVACDRDPDRGPTGSTAATGPRGASTHVPGEGAGATGTAEPLGSTDTIGTVEHRTGTTGGVGADSAASRTGDGNAATTANGTRTGTMGAHGAVNADPWNGPTGTGDDRETSDSTSGQVTGPSSGIAQSRDHAITCTQLIPRAVQRQYLANMTITPTSHGTDIATSCRIEGRGVHAAANIQAWCNPDEDSGLQPDTPTAPAGSKAVGRAAILADAGELQQLTAWDNDSSCQITLAVPKTVDAIALGRRILDGLPAKPVVGSRDEG